MDSFEMTKIAGAVLSALLLIFGVKTIIESRTEHAAGEGPGYTLGGAAAEKPAGAEHAKADAPAPKDAAAPAKEGAAAAPAAAGDAMALLAKANAENGAAIFKKCASCHTNAKGKPKGVGPNLWGVVNRPKASFEGFEYSADMKGKGGNWTFEDLAHFIANPKGFIGGTKMIFPGLSDPAEAADVIAYLATLADTPVALPK